MPVWSGEWLENILWTTLMLVGIYAVSRRRDRVIIGVILTVPFLASSWGRSASPDLVRTWMVQGAAMVFFAYVNVNVLEYVLARGEIHRDRIIGAVCGYLLLGWTWTFLYGIIQCFDPGAIAAPGVPEGEPLPSFDLVHFSFTTLTTLGYGDIAPRSDAARMAAILEAATGTLYVAVLVARLVSLYGRQMDAPPSRE